MGTTSHSTHGHVDAGYEPDVEGRSLVTLLLYVFALSAVFFGTLGGLFMYFRWEADQELARKINTVESQELKDLRSREEQLLGGQAGEQGGKAMPIDQAMQATLKQLQGNEAAAPQ